MRSFDKMTDINFLNMFYDHENSFFNLDKDDIDNKKIEKRDVSFKLIIILYGRILKLVIYYFN